MILIWFFILVWQKESLTNNLSSEVLGLPLLPNGTSSTLHFQESKSDEEKVLGWCDLHVRRITTYRSRINYNYACEQSKCDTWCLNLSSSCRAVTKASFLQSRAWSTSNLLVSPQPFQEVVWLKCHCVHQSIGASPKSVEDLIVHWRIRRDKEAATQRPVVLLVSIYIEYLERPARFLTWP